MEARKTRKGRYGEVFGIKYSKIHMARKCIVVEHDISEAQLELFKEQFKNELSIAQKLDRHRHIIKLVGSFWVDEEDFSILMYPVADCDLRRLLKDCQESWKRASESDEVEFELSESATKRWDELGLGGTLPRKGKDADQRWTLAIQRLQQVMGCPTQAMLWMHPQGITPRSKARKHPTSRAERRVLNGLWYFERQIGSREDDNRPLPRTFLGLCSHGGG